MNQVEIIKAILAGEDLEWCAPRIGGWSEFVAGDPDYRLGAYLESYRLCEFRLKPKTVRYQTRAYLWAGNVSVWTSHHTYNQPETETVLSAAEGDFRWLEETQEKEYTL